MSERSPEPGQKLQIEFGTKVYKLDVEKGCIRQAVVVKINHGYTVLLDGESESDKKKYIIYEEKFDKVERTIDFSSYIFVDQTKILDILMARERVNESILEKEFKEKMANIDKTVEALNTQKNEILKKAREND